MDRKIYVVFRGDRIMDYQGMRTYRRFLQEPVPEAVLGEMMENVRIASCAKNDQPLIYTVVRSPELVKAMQPLGCARDSPMNLIASMFWICEAMLGRRANCVNKRAVMYLNRARAQKFV